LPVRVRTVAVSLLGAEFLAMCLYSCAGVVKSTAREEQKFPSITVVGPPSP
jgi:hypothetical protein